MEWGGTESDSLGWAEQHCYIETRQGSVRAGNGKEEKEGNGTQNGKVKRLPPPWPGKHLSFSMAAYAAGWAVSVENTLVRQLEQGFKREKEREGLQATGSTSGAAKVRVWLILQNAIYGVQMPEGGRRSLSGDL